MAQQKKTSLHRSYFDGMLKEMDVVLSDAKEKKSSNSLMSVYFGGGTPSLADPKDIGGVLEKIDRMVGLDKDCEVCVCV